MEIERFVNNLKRTIEGSKQAQLRFAVCKSVDWANKTMTAVGVSDDVPYEGVQLGFGYMDVKPAVDSVCLIGILEGKESLTFLINAEKVELVEISLTHLSIKTEDYGLQKLLAELIEAIKALTVTTATGPSGTPINFVQFDEIMDRMNKFLV